MYPNAPDAATEPPDKDRLSRPDLSGSGAVGLEGEVLQGEVIADERLDREDAGSTVLRGSSAATHGSDRAGAVGKSGVHVTVGHDLALADDHGALLPRQ